MTFTDLVLLEKTEITAKTPLGEATLVIAQTPSGYSCAVWSKDTLLASNKIGSSAKLFAKAAVIGAMLVKAKEHLSATHEKYPEGLDVDVRVENKGKVQEIHGRIPMDTNQLMQLQSLFGFVRKVNEEINRRAS